MSVELRAWGRSLIGRASANMYRHNHYVPAGYQKRFIPVGQSNKELYYLNLKPETFHDGKGKVYPGKPVRKWGCDHCFAEDDLYTKWLGQEASTLIEQKFFGDIDREGLKAIEYFARFEHPSVDGDAFKSIMLYMSTQKLRTPKGLGWLKGQVGAVDRSQVLTELLRLRNLHCAIWTECIWQIADADRSDTKFIISDHPVTAYNRRCGPRHEWCRGHNDPDILLQGTQTVFPLSLSKVLILTNLSWVRNPYQSPSGTRPNPIRFRSAIFNFMEIQTQRHLDEREVREINFIIKSRASRFVAAGKEEWLYPEEFVSKSDWNDYGRGYLLMPDPRSVTPGSQMMWGTDSGGGGATDDYGRRPWQKDFAREYRTNEDAETLMRFQGEFARLFGPFRRGRSFQYGRLDPEKDSDDFHSYHLGLER
jgi:hypothetical protein